MKTGKTTERPAEELLPARHGYDHLRSAKDDSRSFNSSWLRNGESMPLIQRIGFAIFSLAFVACGVFILNGSIEIMREGDLIFLLWFVVSLAFLYFGILGLRNVLRFKKSE